MVTQYLRRQRRDAEGQALLEFALSVPLILLVLIGIAGFAMLFYSWLTIYHASNRGASYAVLHNTASEADIEEEVRLQMYSLYTGEDNTTIAIQKFTDSNSNPYSITVAIDYTVPLPQFNVPLILTNDSVKLFGPFDINAESIAYYD